MRGLHSILTAAAAIAATAVLAGCGGECYENQNALPQATFVINDSAPHTGSMDSLTVYGIGAPNDSVLWDGGSTEQLFIPFRVDSDTTAYVFESSPSHIRDTVTFIYDRAPVFVSADCGVSFKFVMKSISNTGQLIDSVTCPNGEITNQNIANLVIYLRHE